MLCASVEVHRHPTGHPELFRVAARWSRCGLGLQRRTKKLLAWSRLRLVQMTRRMLLSKLGIASVLFAACFCRRESLFFRLFSLARSCLRRVSCWRAVLGEQLFAGCSFGGAMGAPGAGSTSQPLLTAGREGTGLLPRRVRMQAGWK